MSEQIVYSNDDYSEDGSIDSIETRRFDSKGNVIEYRQDFDANGKDDSIKEFEYYENSDRIKKVTYKNEKDEVTHMTEYEYNSEGDTALTTEKDADGNVKSIYAPGMRGFGI